MEPEGKEKLNTNDLDSNALRLIARVLTLHFQEGLSQTEIAAGHKLSTAKVNRLIKQGRELGMIEFIIHSPFQRLFELEKRMQVRWPQTKFQVIDAVTGNSKTTLDLVGKAAASYLQTILEGGDVVAISGGKAVSAVADNLNAAKKTQYRVVPLTGGVLGQHYTDVNHVATRVAEGLGGTANLMHAPLHADSEEERDMLMSVRTIREGMERAQAAEVALFGVGSVVGKDSTYYAAHLLSARQRKQLYQDGVRAELLGHFIDGSGSLCDSELNSRLVSLPLHKARNIPNRIGVASGWEKVEPICAVLNGRHVSVLIVDDDTAYKVLDHRLAKA